MGKRTGETDFAEIGDQRINKMLDFSKIRTKEEYFDAVRDLLRNTPSQTADNPNIGRNLLSHIEELYEESNAKEKIAEQKQEELDALRKAQLLEAQRSKKSREADERKTHRRTREANKRTVAQWRRGKFRRMDIRSVDTKRRSLFSQKNLITRRDIRLKNINVVLCKNQIKRYKDINTGKWVKNPFKNRR
jgi:hypothetical protein